MNIDKIVLTDEEINQAVQDFLGWHGMKVEVKGIDVIGYPRQGWKVELTAQMELNRMQPPAPKPPIQSVEELATAVEEGTF